jgi:hypothetical protein
MELGENAVKIPGLQWVAGKILGTKELRPLSGALVMIFLNCYQDHHSLVLSQGQLNIRGRWKTVGQRVCVRRDAVAD